MNSLDIEQHLKSGYSQLRQGNFAAAGEHARKVLMAQPKLAQGHFLVGLLAVASDDKRTAISAFGSVTKLQPEHAAAWAQLAQLFCKMGQMNRADLALGEATRHYKGDAVVADSIGTVLSQLGEHEDAAPWFEKSVAAAPEQIGFLVNQANNQIFTGELRQAQATLANVFALDPDNANAHWILAGTRRATDSKHIDVLLPLASKFEQQPHSAAFVYYALGKEYEDLEQWEPAFDSFSKGAAARRQTLAFDEGAEQGLFEALKHACTTKWLAGCGRGNQDTSPIFVVGQPRTGTTLVERMISSHSAVHSAGELQQFGYSIRRLSNYSEAQRYSARLAEMAVELAPGALGDAYLQATIKARGTRARFVDKLPLNYLFLPIIHAALPEAKIVHLQRHPMDACFASFKQLFADAYPHSYDQQEMARHHVRYHALMAIWRERFGDVFHDIAYEAVAADPEPQAQALFSYLDLEFEPDVLNFHQQKQAVATASAVQVREPVHTRSVGRWRRYERQLEPMREILSDAGIDVG